MPVCEETPTQEETPETSAQNAEEEPGGTETAPVEETETGTAEEPSESLTAEEPETEEMRIGEETATAAEEMEKSALLETAETRSIAYTGEVSHEVGQKVTWTIYTNGDLEVTGQGEIMGSSDEWSPWHGYEDSIKKAKIEVTGATRAHNLFSGCNIESVDLSGFDTSLVTDMSKMFYECYYLTSVDFSAHSTSKVTDMSEMFYQCNALTSVTGLDTALVTDMSNMFYDCRALVNVDTSKFNTSNVTDMSSMFYWCSSLVSVDVSGFDTSKVTNMSSMFAICQSLESVDVSGFNTSNVTDMQRMFYECNSLASVDVSKFDTSKVTDMSDMFYRCRSLSSIDLSSFDTSKVTSMWGMFCGCSVLTELDLGGFTIGENTAVTDMLGDCYALRKIVNPIGLGNSTTIALPTNGTYSWRKPDGEKTTNLFRHLTETVILTTDQMFGISFQMITTGTQFSLTDADGKSTAFTSRNEPAELKVVDKGAKDAFTYTIVPADGYIVRSVAPHAGENSKIKLTRTDGENNRCIVTVMPLDNEAGYICDETIDVALAPVGDYSLTISYEANFEDFIVMNGNTSMPVSGSGSISVSNQYETVFCLKTAEREDEIQMPVVRVSGGDEITRDEDTASMSDAEKAYAQKGYAIFRLGRISQDTWVNAGVTIAYRVTFTAEGFPGDVHIYNYIYNRDTSQGERGTEYSIGAEYIMTKGNTVYIQADWTPDAASQYCSPRMTLCSDGWESPQTPVTLDGVEGDVWEIIPNENMEVKFSLKPHTIELANLNPDNFAEFDVLVGGEPAGFYSEEDSYGALKWYVDIRGGSFAVKFRLLDDHISTAWAQDEALSYARGEDGTYTIAVKDMSKIRDVSQIDLRTEDAYADRISLSDWDAQCTVTAKFKTQVYTGEPIEAASVQVRAYCIIGQGGKGKKVILREGTDIDISYQDNINAGTAYMIITMRQDSQYAQYFKGSYTYPFEIGQAVLDDQEKAVRIESQDGQLTYQADLGALFQIDSAIEKGVKPTKYEKLSHEAGGVLDTNTAPTLEGGILTYTIRADANKNSEAARVTILASFQNYTSCHLTLSIQVVKREALVLGGTVAVADKPYDGKEIAPNTAGLKVVSKDGTALNEQESAQLLGRIQDTLSFHYIGVEGTQYDSDESPIDVGAYQVQVKVAEENLDYKSDYLTGGSFKIEKRPVTVTADDMKLYLDDTMPTQYGYHADNLADGDAVSVSAKSFISCAAADTVKVAEYPIKVDAAAVKIANAAGRDVTANYTITAGADGRLRVCEPEPGSYTVIYMDLQNKTSMKRSGNVAGELIEKPIDPEAQGYVFLGWFTDETAAKQWDFASDIIQSDLTLYAIWSKTASEDGGMALCVQDILDQAYTGSAVKPAITVYAADGKTRLKLKKDYTVTYKNNVNASEKDGGIGGTIDDTSQGFDKTLPYVIIQGKGNYTGKVYVNFRILPADISMAEAAGSGYTLKYTDQFEEKANKYAKIVTQFKYKKKGLAYDKAYALTAVKKDGNGGTVPVTLNASGQLLLEAGEYELTISGKGNFTGEIKKTLYVADKTKLLKNAKVSCKRTVSDVTRESLESEAGIQPENLVVKMNNIELTKDKDYQVTCTGNHAIGTATVTVTPMDGSGLVGSKSVTFQIKGTAFKANAVSMEGWQDAVPYTGKARTQNNVTLMGSAGKLTYGTDYTISYKNNIKKGTATAVFTANPSSGYSGSFNKKFKITPLDLSTATSGENPAVQITGAVETDGKWKLPDSLSYKKGGVTPSDRVSLQLLSTGGVLTAGKGKDYTVTYKNNKEVARDTAYMTLKGTGNFTGSIDVYFDIETASLSRLYQEGRVTLTPAAINVSYTHSRYYEDYGDGEGEWVEGDLKNPYTEFKPAITVKDGTTTLKKGVDFEVDYSGNTREELEGGDVLTASVTGIGGYGGDGEPIELSIQVNRASLAKRTTVTVDNENIYSGGPIEPEVSVEYKVADRYKDEDGEWVDAEYVTLTEGTDYTVAYTKNIMKGTGTVKITGIGGYKGSVSKTFKIQSRAIYNEPQSGGEEENES